MTRSLITDFTTNALAPSSLAAGITVAGLSMTPVPSYVGQAAFSALGPSRFAAAATIGVVGWLGSALGTALSITFLADKANSTDAAAV